jgi:hypothetical protein
MTDVQNHAFKQKGQSNANGLPHPLTSVPADKYASSIITSKCLSPLPPVTFRPSHIFKKLDMITMPLEVNPLFSFTSDSLPPNTPITCA